MYLINYRLWVEQPHHQFIEFEARFPVEGEQRLHLQLPAWRPGRYELGNFARNIQSWAPSDRSGRPLPFRKLTKDLWEVDCKGADEVVVRYNYYAAELNGGSSWVDESQLYINPVNCFFYRPERPDASYEITLDLPENWKIACGLTSSQHTLKADGVQQLMDSPFIAAGDLWHRSFEVSGVTFHIWVKGAHRLDETRLINDFKAYTRAQMKAFSDFPVNDYHYLFQFPDFATRHGVEHENSTVITLGPAEKLLTEEGYLEMLGIACHELYHTWNVKSIRPKEMMPYDFSRENYSRLGYVAEGVTTYYGDLYLLRAGVLDLKWYFNELASNLTRHFNNPGRFNLSVADSSFDTWIDGYVQGIPNRKVSIYNEGCLTAFITDVAIMQATNDRSSLDDVMRLMYERFGKLHKGYTENDYRQIVAEVAGKDLTDIFDGLIYGTDDYEPWLRKSFDYLGVEMTYHSRGDFAGLSGALGAIDRDGYLIHLIAPGSPADEAGLAPRDTIVAYNGIRVDEHFSQRIALQPLPQANLEFRRKRSLLSTELRYRSHADYYRNVRLKRLESNEEAFMKWTSEAK